MNRSLRLVLSRIVFLCLLTAALGPLSALAQDYDTYGTADAGDQPTYPGIPPKNKVEGTLGDYTLRVYGTALLTRPTGLTLGVKYLCGRARVPAAQRLLMDHPSGPVMCTT